MTTAAAFYAPGTVETCLGVEAPINLVPHAALHTQRRLQKPTPGFVAGGGWRFPIRRSPGATDVGSGTIARHRTGLPSTSQDLLATDVMIR
jgi:hypothetical protein